MTLFPLKDKQFNFFLSEIAETKVNYAMEKPNKVDLPQKRKASFEHNVNGKKQKRDNQDDAEVRKIQLFNTNCTYSKFQIVSNVNMSPSLL